MHSFQNYHFKDQHPEEEILQVVHRHWFNILIQFISVIFLAFLIFGSIFLLLFFYPQILTALGTQVIFFIETTALLFIWFYGFLIWIDYYLDVWIITNQRIVDVDQKGLFLRASSELQFDKIQDVTTSVSGIIPTILNYGDVYVQTAGEKERFVFRQVPNPYALKGTIMQLYKKAAGKNGNL